MIKNGTTVQYRKTRGKGVVRFHECPDKATEPASRTSHQYLVHFYTGPYAGESKLVWVQDSEAVA